MDLFLFKNLLNKRVLLKKQALDFHISSQLQGMQLIVPLNEWPLAYVRLIKHFTQESFGIIQLTDPQFYFCDRFQYRDKQFGTIVWEICKEKQRCFSNVVCIFFLAPFGVIQLYVSQIMEIRGCPIKTGLLLGSNGMFLNDSSVVWAFQLKH